MGLFNLKTGEIDTTYIPGATSSYPKHILFNRNNFCPTADGGCTYYSPNIFSLYKFEGDNCHTLLTLDMGSRQVPDHFSKRYSYENGNRMQFQGDAKKNGYIPFLWEGFRFKGHYFVRIDDQAQGCCVFSINNPQKNAYYTSLAQALGLPSVPSLAFTRSRQEDELIFSCTPMDFFEHNPEFPIKEVEIANQKITINYNNNPFIIVIR